jgi:hypothetical protein
MKKYVETKKERKKERQFKFRVPCVCVLCVRPYVPCSVFRVLRYASSDCVTDTDYG